MIAAGKLDQRVQLGRKGAGRDAIGGIVAQAFEPYAEVWAHVEPIAMRERAAFAQLAIRAEFRVTIRYRDDLQHGDLLIWRGRQFRVVEFSEPIFRQEVSLYVEAETLG